MDFRFTPTSLDAMAWTIERHGIEAIPSSVLGELGFVARERDARPVLVDVLVDSSAPAVVRERAFGRVAALVGRAVPSRRDRDERDRDLVSSAA